MAPPHDFQISVPHLHHALKTSIGLQAWSVSATVELTQKTPGPENPGRAEVFERGAGFSLISSPLRDGY